MASLLERRDAVSRLLNPARRWGGSSGGPATPRLDNQDDMQTRPFNAEANRPLSPNAYGGAAGANYRRMTESYGRALRQLRRASRRGDTGAALAEIKVREDAMAKGYAHTGGIRRSEDYNADRVSWQDTMKQEAQDAGMEREANRRRVRGELDWRAPRTETGGEETAEGQLGYDPYAAPEETDPTMAEGTASAEPEYDPYAPEDDQETPWAPKPKERGFFSRLFRKRSRI
ncbi:MAG: hypothetical protein WC718_00375 [Phycisphaerales bacterium]|jgi:hypothetical protein